MPSLTTIRFEGTGLPSTKIRFREAAAAEPASWEAGCADTVNARKRNVTHKSTLCLNCHLVACATRLLTGGVSHDLLVPHNEYIADPHRCPRRGRAKALAKPSGRSDVNDVRRWLLLLGSDFRGQ